MNILLVNLGRHYGGAETITEKLLYEIKGENINIYLVCIKDSTLYNKNKKISPLTLPQNKLLFISYFFKILYYIYKYKIDILHCHGVTSVIFGTLCAKISRRNVITTVHGRADYDRNQSFSGEVKNKLEKAFLKLNDKCVSVSKYMNDYLIDEGVKKSNAVLIYNDIGVKNHNIDSKKIDFDFISNDIFTIACIGRLERVKGQKYLVMAMKKLVEDNLKINCIIAGEGSDRQTLEEEIKENNLDEYIKLIGYIDDTEDLISKVNLVVVPSVMESFGIVILEGMKEKKCVIASNVGGIPELINDEQTGYLVEPCNVEQLYSQIRYCYKNIDKTKLIGEKAYEYYVGNWQLDKMTKSYVNLYTSLYRRK